MKISRRTRGGFLGAVVLTLTAMWSVMRFQNVPLSADEGPPPLPITPTVSAVNIEIPKREAAPVGVAQAKTTRSLRQMAIVDEVLRSGRDGDPRLDTDLRILDPEVRAYLRNQYGQEPVEKRNRRGTLVFLLGRNLRSIDDFRFFAEVLQERPCLSLTNCAKRSDMSSSHHSAGISTTLAYPQLVALSALDTYLRGAPAGDSHVSVARSLLRIGSRSKIPTVARLAHRLSSEHSRAVARFDRNPTAN